MKATHLETKSVKLGNAGKPYTKHVFQSAVEVISIFVAKDDQNPARFIIQSRLRRNPLDVGTIRKGTDLFEVMDSVLATGNASAVKDAVFQVVAADA